MWQKLRIVFTIPELRHKIFLTLALLGVYRIGWAIPLPMVDSSKTSNLFGGAFSDLFTQVAVFSASNLQTLTVFGLGIMPYISASIIFQLLGTVYPPLERLQKEGESGRKKITEYTRYTTIIICLIQSMAYLKMYSTPDATGTIFREGCLVPGTGLLLLRWQILAVFTMTAGTAFLMWLGEQIDEYGIGNGISLLIMAGIIARMPGALHELVGPMITDGVTLGGQNGVDKLILLMLLFVAVIVGVVFMERGQRRIPTQSAKHVRGRRVYGGTRQHLPLKVNQAGVMPIIFASSLLMIPSFLFLGISHMVSNAEVSQTLSMIGDLFQRGQGFMYNICYIGLIFFFCYFWTAITFNPKDMAENLKNYGSFIPGHRPGRPTAEYLEKVMIRITYVGAGFLALVAIVPSILSSTFGISLSVSSFFGGTGLLIAVSVAIDLVQKIDNHLLMRNYGGLLEK